MEVNHFAYKYTWPEILELVRNGQRILSYSGYIIHDAGRAVDERALFGAWGVDVARAVAHQLDMPAIIKEEYEARVEARKAGDLAVHLQPPVLKNAKGKNFTWSFSAINDFLTCPAQYAAKRYYESVKESPTEATIWGSQVHKVLELYIAEGQPLPEGMQHWAKYADSFLGLRARGYDVQVERQVAINRCLAEVPWFDQLVWGRGVVDVLAVQGETAVIADWKGLALGTPIPTPGGWTTMGEVQIGDTIFGGDGTPCKVVGKSDVHHRKCFRLAFSDQSEIVCDDEHLWPISDVKGRVSVTPTSVIADRCKAETAAKKQHMQRIKVAAPLSLPDIALTVHPYVLGCWLGDGKHTDGSICKPDADLYANIEACGYHVLPAQKSTPDKTQNRTVKGLRTELGKLGVLGNKHIPEQYLRASYTQRLDLLRGIADTDGSWNPIRNQCTITTVDAAFGKQVLELVRTLGLRPKMFTIDGFGFGKAVRSYDVAFTPIYDNPFWLPRKAAKVDELLSKPRKGVVSTHRTIRSATEVATVPTQCIAVDSSGNTYLCGEEFMVTHNTGKQKDDQFQLDVFCALTHIIYPEVKVFKPRFIWLKTGQVTGTDRTERDLPRIWQTIIGHTNRIEDAWRTGNFVARSSGLCRGWCPVATCPYCKEKS